MTDTMTVQAVVDTDEGLKKYPLTLSKASFPNLEMLCLVAFRKQYPGEECRPIEALEIRAEDNKK